MTDLALKTSPSPYIDDSGITVPQYIDYFSWLQAKYRAIYGQEIVLDADTQDGQFIGIYALAASDLANLAGAVFNSFSPAKARGVGLSSLLKINGLRRKVATHSTVDVLLVGQYGVAIVGAVVADENGVNWTLPSCTIPISGQIVVTAVCNSPGSIALPANSPMVINNPVPGWQSATSNAAATEGAPVETDAQARQRQALSTELPSAGIMDGLIGAIYAVPGVTRVVGYENPTTELDAHGIPGGSIAMVVEGGDVSAIGAAIAAKKPACGTFGTTSYNYTTSQGIPRTINFFRPTSSLIQWQVDVKAGPGWGSATSLAITNALVAYTLAIPIGGNVSFMRAVSPANLIGSGLENTFEIVAVRLSQDGGLFVSADIPLTYIQAATCASSNVLIRAV